MEGIIEGFYGRPWTWDERAEVCASATNAGCATTSTHPKTIRCTGRWRTPYGRDVLDGFTTRRRGHVARGLRDLAGVVHRRRLTGRSRRAAGTRSTKWSVSVSTSCASRLDDIPFGAGAGRRACRAHPVAARPSRRPCRPVLIPTEYVGTGATPLPRGARRGRTRRRADRVDRLARRECDHHCRRGPGASGRDARTAAAAVGQLSGQRRVDGGPAPPRPAVGARPVSSTSATATWRTRWCSRAVLGCRWRRSPRGCGAVTR